MLDKKMDLINVGSQFKSVHTVWGNIHYKR